MTKVTTARIDDDLNDEVTRSLAPKAFRASEIVRQLSFITSLSIGPIRRSKLASISSWRRTAKS